MPPTNREKEYYISLYQQQYMLSVLRIDAYRSRQQVQGQNDRIFETYNKLIAELSDEIKTLGTEIGVVRQRVQDHKLITAWRREANQEIRQHRQWV